MESHRDLSRSCGTYVRYNWVLRGALTPGVDLVCYADDTLIVARGRDWDQAAVAANVEVNLVVRRIGMLGLRVAAEKTEAMWFCQKGKRLPLDTSISINGVHFGVGSGLKYLGLTLDKTWSFRDHFAQMAPRIRKEVSNFSRLLPNIGGQKMDAAASTRR